MKMKTKMKMKTINRFKKCKK